MLRVKNEEDFIEPCVLSIIDLVERVVIIDNLSTDATPAIVQRLAQQHPGKIASYSYEHQIARVGKDNEELAAQGNNQSPCLLANFYNFCLSKCRTNFVLKWDGDMIASPAFGPA